MCKWPRSANVYVCPRISQLYFLCSQSMYPTVQEKSVLLISHCCICFHWATDSCSVLLVTARAFMSASLIVIPYTMLEILMFLGQLPVYHWRWRWRRKISGIASLHLELDLTLHKNHNMWKCEGLLISLPYLTLNWISVNTGKLRLQFTSLVPRAHPKIENRWGLGMRLTAYLH